MSETLAVRDNQPTEKYVQLYKRWADGGAGILITGNVMIDRSALGEPGNVVVEDDTHLAMLKSWAEAGTSTEIIYGCKLTTQENKHLSQSPKHQLHRVRYL